MSKKRGPVDMEELSGDIQNRAELTGKGKTGTKKSTKPFKQKCKITEKPEFLQQRRGSSSAPLFNELFEDDMRIEELELPSKGYLYGWESGFIKLRPYNTAEQKIISTINKNNYNSIVSKLFSACIVEPSYKDFPVTEYTIGDSVAILFWLRANSWSPTYEYSGVTCDECGKKNIKPIELDLTEINFKYLKERPKENEPFEVIINKRVTIYTHLLRRKDEIDSERQVKKLEKMNVRSEGDEWLQPYISCTDELLIDGSPYEGTLDNITLMKFFEKMPTIHHEKIEKVQNKYLHGVDTTIKYKCPFCDAENEKLLPIDPSFFFHGL